MATKSTTPCPLPSFSKQKPARMNPARRKAAKAKEAANEPQPVKVECSAAQALSTDSDTTKAVSSQTRVRQTAESRGSGNPKAAAASEKKIQSKRTFQTQSHKAGTCHTERSSLSNPAFVTGGLMGCVAGGAILLGAGLCSRVVGVESAVHAAQTSKAVVDNLIDDTVIGLKAGIFNAPEAIDLLRRTSLAYASALPGGIAFVEHLFREVDVVRRQRGEEIDRVLADACGQLADARKRRASTIEMHATVLKQMARLSDVAGSATQDMVARNPALNSISTGVKRKVPTIKLNMAVRQKGAATAASHNPLP